LEVIKAVVVLWMKQTKPLLAAEEARGAVVVSGILHDLTLEETEIEA
jgi:hypothetical protein